MRLLGVGDSPAPIEGSEVDGEVGCDSVGMKWYGLERGRKNNAVVFPVHAYRVQRRMKRTTGVRNGGSNKKENYHDILTRTTPPPPTHTNKSVNVSESEGGSNSKKPIAAYTTVYHGNEPEFVDENLRTGSTYIYRIQSWNAVGHSTWSFLEVTTPAAVGDCAYLAEEEEEGGGKYDSNSTVFLSNVAGWFSTTMRYSSIVSNLSQFLFTLIALAAAVMRLKRGSTTSTGSGAMVPLFPWLWRGLNSICLKIFGGEIFPAAMLTDVDALQKGLNGHDLSYGAVGLAGNKNRKVVGDGRLDQNEYTQYMKDRRLANNKSPSFASLKGGGVGVPPPIRIDATDAAGTTGGGTATPSPKNNNNKQNPNSKGASFSKRFSFSSKQSKKSETETTPSPGSKPSFSLTTPKKSLRKNSGAKSPPGSLNDTSQGIQDNEEYWLDNTRCNICEKKYKLLKRMKHTCSRCLSTFCHQHGRTNHSNFTSCKVPGSCVCDFCLRMDGSPANLRKKKGK